MVKLLKQNSEVEYSQTDVLTIDSDWINRIKHLAKSNESNKYRTCIHFSDADNVHEMLIAATPKTYIRPHKHRVNGESLQFIEGEARAIIFNDDGTINILDIVLITNLILLDDYQESADMNGDENLNILDIVQLVNIILGS